MKMFTRLLFALVLCCVSVGFARAQYCIPVSANGCSDGDQIQLFTVGAFSNTSGCESDTGVNGYGDFTDLTGLEIPIGSPTSVVLQTGFGTQQVSIWIDADNSESFENSELILTDLPIPTADQDVITEVTVPATIAEGTYRLRVQTAYNAPSSGDACTYGTANYGETEDYTVTVTAAPACPSPSGLVISDITSEGATLSFTNNGTGDTFDVEIVEAGETPTGTPTAGYDDLTGTTVTITGLNPIQEYNVFVRADCGAEQSPFNGPISFTTGCAAVTPDYYEPFNEFPPNCWDLAEGGSPAEGFTTLVEFNSWGLRDFANDGGSSAVINLFNVGDEDWLISPEFDLTGGGYQVEWNFAVTEYFATTVGMFGSDDELYFLITPDNGVTWITLDVFNAETETTAEGETKIYDLEDYAGQIVRFAFFGTEGEVDDPEDIDVFVDEFRVRTPPSCLEPVSLTLESASAEAATVLVSGGGADSGETFDFIVVPAGQAPGNEPDAGYNDLSNPATLEGLEAQTLYDVYVRVDCGSDDTDVSEFIGPFTIETPCAAFDTPYLENFNADFGLPDCWGYAEDGSPFEGPDTDANFSSWFVGAFPGSASNSMRVSLTGTFVDDWLLTPSFDIPVTGETQVDFLAAMTPNGVNSQPQFGSDDEVYFLISTDNGATYSLLELWNADNLISSVGAQFIYDLNEYAGQTVSFAFFATDGEVDDEEGNIFYVDDFQVREPAPCPDIAGISISGITFNSAQVQVVAGQGDLSGFDFEIVEEGATPTGNPTTGFDNVNGNIVLTDLMPNTTYIVYVRTDCSDDNTDVGAYVQSAPFTTACAPLTAPYSDDLNGELPDCWSEATGGSLNGGPGEYGFGGWYSDVFGNIDGETNAFTVNLYTTTEDDWLVSPFFNTQSNGVYTVTFELALTIWNQTDPGVMGSDDEVRLLYSANGIDWNTALLYNSDSTSLSTTGQQVSVDIDGVDGNLMFAFWATEGATDDTEDIEFFVRDFTVTEEIVIAPLSIVATNVTDVSCNGESDGAIELVVDGGTAPYTFDQDLTNLAAGTYTITVTDAMGMTITTDPITVAEPDAIDASVVGTDETVAGANDGTASVDNPTGGTEPYTYAWTNGATTQTITGLAPDNEYCVTITDANGCVFDAGCVTIMAGTSSTSDLETLRSLSTMPNPTDGQLRVALELSDVTDLELQLTDALGRTIAAQRFSRTNEVQTSFDLGHLPAGLYLLRVYDLNSNRYATRRVVRE